MTLENCSGETTEFWNPASGNEALGENGCLSIAEPRPVFIVDDNRDDQFLLGREIRALFGDIPVRLFRDGRKLIEYMDDTWAFEPDRSERKQEPRLILMDLYMPEMDGFLTLKRLRQDLGLLKIPVILISNTVDSEDIDMAYRYGANAFLSKPFSRLNFMQALRRNSGLTPLN